jgi:peroxiredoxin
MVHLQKLHERYAKDGLLVFAISMLPDAERARARTQKLGITYPVLHDSGSDLGRRYSYG